jgi:prepilin-type N-terminal cleavage/methylation domain-containing protein
MPLRSMKLRSRLSQSGDTIVEVLIAIAIVSSVLAGAFSVTQKSVRAVRSSQEHAEMLQLLQGQVELVRAIAVNDIPGSAALFGTVGSYYCIDTSSKALQIYSGGEVAPAGNLANVPAACKGLSGLYNIGIKATKSVDGNYTFTFNGWWDAQGGGTNNMQLSYKISPTS